MSAATASKAFGDSLNHDLHIKMSKKIAQLTKVIYVLNTRNDDHETVLEEISKKHKLELRQTVAEVTERVQELETSLKNQSFDQSKILELQGNIKSQETILDQTKAEFLNYKEEVNRNHERMNSEHIQQLNELNNTISSLGTSYKILLRNYDELQKNMNSEKIKAVVDIEDHYEKKITELMEQFSKKEQDLRDLISGRHKDLETELIKAQEQVKTVMYTKEKTVIDYEDKIKELRSTLEKELSESMEETKRLHELELEKANRKIADFKYRLRENEESNKSVLEKYLFELKEKDVCIEDSKKEIELIRTDNKEKIKLISKCVNEANTLKDVITNIEGDLKSKKMEIDNLKRMQDNINVEIESKTKQIKDLKNASDSSYKKMISKDNELKEALCTIEAMNHEIKEMSHCPKSVSVDYEIEIQSLKRALEVLTNEKLMDKQTLDRLQLDHEIELADLQNRMRNEYNFEMDKMTKKSEKEWSVKEKVLKEEIQKLKEDCQLKLEEERSKASKIIEKMKTEMEQIKGDITSKLKSKEKQISLHETTIVEREKDIKVLALQNKNIKETVTNIKKDNHKLTTSIAEKEIVIEKLTEDLKVLQQCLDEQILEKEKIQRNIKVKAQEDISEKYNQLSADLDKKWADTMRRETGRIRNDMLDNFAKEKEKIIENVERIKNEKIAILSKELDEIRATSSSQILFYKDSLSKLEIQLHQRNEESTRASIDKIHQLENKMENEKASYFSEISRIEDGYSKQIEHLSQRYEKEKSQYIAEMETLLETTEREWGMKQNSMITTLKEENEKAMNKRMDEITNKHNRQMNDQISEIQLQMMESQQSLFRGHEDQIKGFHQKIHSLEDQMKVQTTNNRAEMEKSKAAKLASENSYMELEQSLEEFSKENSYLKRQLDEFSDDYHRNQKANTEKMRQSEIELKHHYEQIIIGNKLKYEEDSKQTLQDFTKAQNLFKEKIKELSGKLLEAEERYDVRPSRDEDIELIETLKAQLRTSEKEIERMNEEKKFFQLELINRETNFNKIFNAAPNVAKQDTTQSAIKTKKGSNEKMKTFQKLTPLPGSPFHDDPINPARPLPPSRKSIDAS